MSDPNRNRAAVEARLPPSPLHPDESILRQAVAQNAPSATYIARLDSTAANLFVSPEVERLLDLKPNESIADPNFWYNHLHPDDRDGVMAEIARQQTSDRPIRLTYRMVTGSGAVRVIRDEAFVVRDAAGRPLFLQGILRDISARQQAESALTETFDRLRFLESIIEQSPTMVFRWRLDDRESVEFVTENIAQLGYAAADLTEQRLAWPHLIHPADRARRLRERNTWLHNGVDEFVLNYRLITLTGDERWFEDRSRVLRDAAGEPTHIEALLVDITPRKVAEQNLTFQNGFRAMLAALRATPDDAGEGEIWLCALHALIDAFGLDLAWYGPVQNGETAPLYWAGPAADYLDGLALTPLGRPPGVSAHCPVRRLLETATPQAGEVASASDCPFQAAALKRGLQSVLAIPCFNAERTLTGVLVLYRTETRSFPPGHWDRFQDLAQEIDALLRERRLRREADDNLRKSESRYRFLVDHITDVLWTCDPQLRIRDVSPSVERFQGFTREELIGQPIGLILPPRQMEVVRRRLKEELAALSRGVEAFDRSRRRTVELIAHHKDGRPIWLEVTYFFTFDEAGRVDSLFGVSRDITDRKQAELRLQESERQYLRLSRRLQTIREEESTRISRVIHDDLGQSLSVLKMDTVRISRRLAADQPDLAAIAEAMVEMIDRAIATTQGIAMDLHPGILDDLGLAPAMEWYIQRLQPHTETRLSLAVDPPDLAVPPAIALALFRILQEAATNTLRHAAATRFEIRLTDEAEGFRLILRDDGRGIPAEALTAPTAFGLIQMRERARTLGGRIAIESLPGRGTTITVDIPPEPPAVEGEGVRP